jgi:putative phosphoesterase
MRARRVAIVSDTHSFLSPDVLAIVDTCDIAVHAGDIGGKEILDALQSCTGHVLAVRGNNDVERSWATDDAAVVNALPQVAELQLPGGIMVVEHGHRHGRQSPDHEKLRNSHPQAKLIVYGHTHKKIIDQKDTPWVVNPGAAGKTRNHGGPSCLVLHASDQSWTLERFRF